MRVQQALERSIASKLANIDLKVEGNVLATIVERLDRAANLVVASPSILLLPRPKDVVQVTVVQVEEWVCSEEIMSATCLIKALQEVT